MVIYDRAKATAQAIMDLGQYELDSNYSNLFTVAGQGSKEIIASVQRIENFILTWSYRSDV